jgi:hypothetical protein
MVRRSAQLSADIIRQNRELVFAKPCGMTAWGDSGAAACTAQLCKHSVSLCCITSATSLLTCFTEHPLSAKHDEDPQRRLTTAHGMWNCIGADS